MLNLSKNILIRFQQEWEADPELLEWKSYDRNDNIFKHGEYANHIYFVRSGMLQIVIGYQDKEATVGFYIPNDVVVPFNCIIEEGTAICTLKAMTKCELLALSKEKYAALASRDNEIATGMFKLAVRFSAQCIRHIADLEMLSVKERYAALHKELGEYMYEIPEEHLASYIGTDRVYLNKVKNNFYAKYHSRQK
jgi:CRP-like cAMP-binding protein